MDKDANINGQGRSVLTRLSLLEAKVNLIALILKWLVGGVITALATYLWNTVIKP